MTTVFHPNRPRQINSRYLDEDGYGSGLAAPVITDTTVTVDYADAESAGVIQVHKIVFAGVTTTTMRFILLAPLLSPTTPIIFDSGVNAALAGLCATDITFTINPTQTSNVLNQFVCQCFLTAAGQLTGRLVFHSGTFVASQQLKDAQTLAY
jgi:hypothetical protein